MNFDRLKAFLDNYLSDLGIPGSDTIIYKDRKEVFRYQSGFENIEKGTPMRPDLLYNLYSCTKVSTGVAATQLIERGEIVPTDPLYAYFPEFKDVTVKVKNPDGSVDICPAKNPILLQHLLTMTSGFNYNLARPSLAKVKKETDGRCPTLDVVKALAEDPLEFEPGTNYQYGLSLDIVGGIIELVSGMSVGEYMRRNIFEPLGMKNTSFGITEEKKVKMATQYYFDNKDMCAKETPKENNPFVFGPEYQSAGAGLISCVDDQILLTEALTHMGVGLNGERILSEAGVNLMRANALTPETQKGFVNASFKGYGYGYCVRTNVNPHAVGNLSPVGEFGWDGAKMCYLSCDPQNKLSIFHAEHMGGFAALVWPRFRNVIYSCLDY